jgi:hypothetical protein
MIDIDRINTLLKEKRDEAELARLAKIKSDREECERAEVYFVETVIASAQALQQRIESAILLAKQDSVHVLSDRFIPYLVTQNAQRFGDSGISNIFVERFCTPYSANRYDNPFYSMYDPLHKLGMQWKIIHTEASRDPEYRYSAYDSFVLLLPNIKN